jgi:trigger factor
VIIKRVGRQAVLDEAVRDSIGLWYTAAIDAAHIVPIGEPDLDMGDLPGEGQPLRFSIEIGVRPKAQLGDYLGLEVGRREPEVAEDAVDAEVEALRERTAKLESVERAAQRGDFVVMDFQGTLDGEPFAGGEGRDQMVELGSGRLVPGFEEQLEGAAPGQDRTVSIVFPDDYGATDLAGRTAEFAVTVKDVKARDLPPLDEDFAAEAGFDTLEELRTDIRERLTQGQAERIEAEYREAVLDSAVAGAQIDVPDSLVDARARELWDNMVHSLEHQGISKDAYLRIAGRSEEEVVAQGAGDARRALEREAVLAAIIEAEGIDPTEEQLLRVVEEGSRDESTPPRKLLERLRSAGRLDELKADVAQRQALDLLVERSQPIPVEQARARDKLWTPGAEERPGEAAGGRLWTPGS